MSDENQDRRIDAIVDRLCDLSTGEREAWLEANESEPAIREAVRRVLKHIDGEALATERLLAVGDEAAEIVAGSAEDQPLPESVGPYRVLGTIGAGGMGQVYLAEQLDPKRQVAVKVLRAGVFSTDARRRFEREADLLARLQHPGIAQVIELGRTPEGQTYLVMERIEGTRLTGFADERELDLRGRLALIADLADAVHHAHLRGVIHRDLKPANVLVTTTGQVKVIDFGVARTLEVDDEGTLQTSVGQLIGTLGYMSPEQLRGDPLAVDARADVYALGVIAYELLGGQLPHEVSGVSVTDAVRKVVEQDAPILGRIAPNCRGDVEIIVAKALEKERERRYASASALAADIRRFLADEPIQARRPSLGYSLGKLARRHRLAFGLAAAALLSTVTGAAVAVAQAIENRALAERERIAREDAQEQESIALAESEKANAAAAAALEAQREAERLSELAEERADEIERRADPGRLVLARAEAESLWPALPETIPAIDAWLRRYAEPLRANLHKHAARLEELREGAQPYDEATRERDYAEHPIAEAIEVRQRSLENCRLQIAGEDPRIPDPDDDEKARLAQSIERLEAELIQLEEARRERRTWAFADPVEQEQHDHLAQLIVDLREFTAPGSVVADVEARRSRALRVEAETVENPEPAARWLEAIEDVGRSPVYGGLELTPQVGLLPLRRDPTSGLWEFWVFGSGDVPEPATSDDATTAWRLHADTGIVMVLIPPSSTVLGAQPDDPDGPNHDPLAVPLEGQPRTVELPAYFVSKYELTQAQWRLQTGEEPSQYGPTFQWAGIPPGETVISSNTWWNPVELVSQVDSTAVLGRIGLRLPTGDEWEVAARAGTTTPWWTGTEVASLQGAANVADGAVERLGGPVEWQYTSELEDDWVAHAPVGSFGANAFGLHDVLGNVWEWTSDEPSQGLSPTRGGCYEHSGDRARVTSVEFGQQISRSRFVGVRPARSLEPAGD